MLRRCFGLLVNWQRAAISDKYLRMITKKKSLRRRYRAAAKQKLGIGPMWSPLQQIEKRREERLQKAVQRYPKPMYDRLRYMASYAKQKQGKSFGLAKESLAVNEMYMMHMLGDNKPLSELGSLGITERQRMLYSSQDELMRDVQPGPSYTPLVARKLAAGDMWPSAPPPSERVREITRLMHEENMSNSAREFSRKIEYWIRRDIRSCPAHIEEKIDFAQLIVQRVLASRRSMSVYIVWSTLIPAARFKLEPFLTQLNHWLVDLIRRRIKTVPNIPKILWIYNGGMLQKELPKKLLKEIEDTHSHIQSTLDERMKYLKSLDSLQYRMKGVPWFMPYLWAKDKLMERSKKMTADLQEVTKRNEEAAKADKAQSGKPPTYVR